MRPYKFSECNIEIAKDQPQYLTLPAYKPTNDMQGYTLVCWQLSFRERIALLFYGKLWHSILTFNKPLQPILLEVTKPAIHFKEAKPIRKETQEGAEE
jgi:hypothetical protein